MLHGPPYNESESSLPTIIETITEADRLLQDSMIDDQRRTASLLMRHVLGWDQAQLIMRSDEIITSDQRDDFFALVERRAAGEPSQYIVGHQEFFGLEFTVTPEVLIPRPETEFLVEQVISLANALQAGSASIADVGTGSGCIATAIAVNVPGARLVATDISATALEVASANAQKHRVRDRIEFLQGDLVEPLKASSAAPFDIIATNPPYVPSSNPNLLPREVREHEPAVALFGGEDGLDNLRRLLNTAPAVLKSGGHMVIEIGYTQIEATTRLLDPAVWELIEVVNDLQVIPRTLTLRKK